MLPHAQVLTTHIAHANYKESDLPYSAKSLISSSFIFLHIDQSKTKSEEEMQQPSPTGTIDDQLWYRMGNRRREVNRQEHEQSAYQYTSSHHSASRSISPSRLPQIPVISTSSVDKPLPSPPASQRKNKPASLRSLLSRQPSHESLDTTHLQPHSARPHKKTSSKDGKLSPLFLFPTRTSSRSMPTSPLEASSSSIAMFRPQSSSASYATTNTNQPAPLQPKQRSISTETYFEPGSLRPRTFHESNHPTTAFSTDPRTSAPRPHTAWFSSNEPFNNDTEFHLFAEATCGLPDGSDPMSPNETLHLEASLFSSGRQNDVIPLPFQNPSSTRESWQPPPGEFIPRQHPREPSPSHPDYSRRTEPVVHLPSMSDDWTPSQSSREFETSSSALPSLDSYDLAYSGDPAPLALTSSTVFPRRASFDRPQISQMPANLLAVNRELERLGVEDEDAMHDDDELPNYAQSQAEMQEQKRKEAAARARELESRWNSARGRGRWS